MSSMPEVLNPEIQVVQFAPTPAPMPPHSRYHLSQEQIQFFDTHGYLVLRGLIDGEMLERLQTAGSRWIEHGLEANSQDPHRGDYQFAKRPNGEVFYRVDYLHNKAQTASLELLGDPRVLGIAESLCGQNFVPTYESMVFKQQGDGEQIPWHQDAVHPRKYRVFNFDLYLDRSSIGAGALRVVPGTQTKILDVCEVRDQFGWDAPSVIQVEMEPGDVLLHDVMVLHGSERTAGKALRRTIYYEFRAAEEILEDGPWDEAWIEKRIRLVPLGLNAFARAFPEKEQFDWKVSPEFRPAPLQNETEELKVAHVVHMNGSYCSAGDAKKAVS